MYQALYRKYRPKTFDDVVGQEHITETLKNQVRNDKLSHAYLFIGTRGTGKTTCAKILAKAVNCPHTVNGNPCNQCPTCRGIDDGTIMDVVELDAASNNGVDHVRALRDEAIFSPAGAKKRVYIIDEVHMLSTPAFNALLKIMEEPPAHLMFILATTELKKVPATILSRCQRHTFKRIDSSVVAKRLHYVADQEGLTLTDGAANLLGRLADGSMRDALSLMDQVLGDGNITEESVLSSTGLAGSIFTTQLLDLVAKENTSEALMLFHKLWNDGKDPSLLLNELSVLLRDILLYMTAPDRCENLLSGNFNKDTLANFAAQMRPAMLMQHLDTVQNAQEKLKDSRNQRMTVELCLIAMCDPSLSEGITALRARVDRLEQQVAQGIPAVAVSAPAAQAERKKQQERPSFSQNNRPPWAEEPAPAAPPKPKMSYEEMMAGASVPASKPEPIEDRPPWDEEPAPATPPKRKMSYEEMMAGASVPASKPEPIEDRPPWDEEPPMPVDDYERPPFPEEPPMPMDEPVHPSRKAEPQKNAGVNPNWEPFMNVCRDMLPPFLSGLLPQCSGDFDDNLLVIHAPSFPYGQLNTPANLQKLRQCAQTFYGHPVELKLEPTTSNTPRQATRSVDELSRFEGVVKFK